MTEFHLTSGGRKMPDERNDLELSSPDSRSHMTLNILDIIRFLNKLKLEYLGDEIATEIIVNYNANVDEAYYIEESMSGQDIRDQFNKLPNTVKQLMSKKTLISDEVSKGFFTQILKNSTEQYEFFVRDTEIKGGLINAFAVVIIISCLLIYFVYANTTGFRGEIGDTVSAKIGNLVVEYIQEKIP